MISRRAALPLAARMSIVEADQSLAIAPVQGQVEIEKHIESRIA
jgi:hypothetical protein